MSGLYIFHGSYRRFDSQGCLPATVRRPACASPPVMALSYLIGAMRLQCRLRPCRLVARQCSIVTFKFRAVC
jgi:hypothetical protein